MAQIKLTVRGKEVTINDSDVLNQEVPTREVVGTVGTTSVTRRLTFGAVDGPRIVLTQVDVQASLDTIRQGVAAEAVWQEELKSFVSNLN